MKFALLCVTLGTLSLFASHAASVAPATAPIAADTAIVGLADVYGGLADSILANKRTEKAVVMAILKVERDLVFDALDRAMAGDGGARAAELQRAARHVGEFATEGGSIIEPVRNRLLQGGHHHHHADGTGSEETYDKGYVVVAKTPKRQALDLAKRCAQLAMADADEAQIKALRDEFASLAQGLIE